MRKGLGKGKILWERAPLSGIAWWWLRRLGKRAGSAPRSPALPQDSASCTLHPELQPASQQTGRLAGRLQVRMEGARGAVLGESRRARRGFFLLLTAEDTWVLWGGGKVGATSYHLVGRKWPRGHMFETPAL